MPIYEYHCQSCGLSCEKIRKQPQAQMICPRCGGTALRQVSHTAAAGSRHGGCVQAPTGRPFT